MATTEPTYNPTRAEKKLLEVILDPTAVSMTITDICATAGVVRNIYYDAMEKPEFVAYYHEIVKGYISAKAAPLINSALKEAEKGSFQHIKLLLEMAGLHTDSKTIDHSSKDGSMTPKGLNDFYDEETDT